MNYFEVCVRDVTDPEKVGTSTGEVDGELRICVSLEGELANPHLDYSWKKTNWTAMTPAAAKTLYELLGMNKHLWEDL